MNHAEDKASTERTSDRQTVFDYRALRLFLGCIAFALPIVVTVQADGPALQSISASYHSEESRDWFVGMLFIVGAFLFAYRGWDKYQAAASIMAGFSAFVVALVPTRCDECDPTRESRVHYVAAGILFAILTYFCFVYFRADIKQPRGQEVTLRGRPQTAKEKTRSGIYLACGCTMAACVVTMLVFLLPGLSDLRAALRITYWVEAIALAAFGVAWFTAGKLKWLADEDEALVLLRRKPRPDTGEKPAES